MKTDSLSEESIGILKGKYGGRISILIDPAYKNTSEYAAAKSSWDNWNNLGAGLAIDIPSTGRCSTAGVAYKGTSYFLITAGHCIPNKYETITQYKNYDVGHAHLDARESDFDLGLISLDSLSDSREIPGGRYASSGLYQVGTEASAGGYDAHLRGAESPSEGRRVCKTGTSTGYTCGKVVDTYAREWFSQVHVVVDVLPGEGTYTGNYLMGKGDSGGALYNPGNYNLIGITSEQYTISGAYYTVRNGNQVPVARKGLFTPFVLSAQKYDLYLYTNTTRKEINQ